MGGVAQPGGPGHAEGTAPRAGRTVRIGSGSGYWGSALEPALDLAERGHLDYIGFDYLAELTMSLLQRERLRNPGKGYIEDMVEMVRSLLPAAIRNGTRLVANGGGANPLGAAERALAVARELRLPLRVGVVEGDDILVQLPRLEASGWEFVNLDTGERGLDGIRDRIVAAHAYLGAEGIAEALGAGAQLVVTGRVSDNALYVGPLMHEFGWRYEEPYWDRIAAAVTVGHLIECAEMVTGGMTVRWRETPDPWNLGYPIAEVTELPGGRVEAVITKLPGTGGRVDSWSVKEHLVYEVHDPRKYVMPDAVADFTRLRLTDLGEDRVLVREMGGGPRPDTLKVQIGYTDGWIAEGRLGVSWPYALEKARRIEEWLRRRLEMRGVRPLELRFDRVGVDMLHGEAAPWPDDEDAVNEIELRVAVRTRTPEEAETARREFFLATTWGPAGTGWGAPLRTRQVISLFPTLVPREAVEVRVRTLDA
ncbi:MAG: DUF1446 domain-containing protein [Bacillota bacterium]|nr:DUF1446 domain-containing protein [Bacillota bacterium]